MEKDQLRELTVQLENRLKVMVCASTEALCKLRAQVAIVEEDKAEVQCFVNVALDSLIYRSQNLVTFDVYICVTAPSTMARMLLLQST